MSSKTFKTVNQLTKSSELSEMSPNPVCTRHQCRVVVKNLTVQKNDAFLLQNVSFEALHGQLIAIVGKSGSGKSTLLRALAGEVEHSGDISGIGEVALMRQNVPLLPDTLRENITMHRNFSETIITNFLKQVEGSDLLSRLNDIVVNDNVSGGERQRIGLARATIGQPQVLLLDEPTRALDVETEMNIFEHLMRLARKQNTIILIVSHRVTLCEQADQVVVIDDGKLVQQGRHKELKSDKHGTYYNLLQGARFAML
ncbi:unnamed protein product [Durusdinium trenchii]|uniref:ATP-dependent lipid A-core flippase (Lipid A export ATP-binding/permease protein MsbA) n=2 Tax=Durusdinium trenchii TaxID=1381693 RepID=A0ABP0IAB6_9DINO